MAVKYKLFAKRFFLILNILTAIVFLLACLAPYLNPSSWWFITFLGLGFGIIFILLVSFIFLWLVFKPKYVFISLVCLLIGWKSISIFFAFNINANFRYKKADSTLRVVHWNVARFVEWKRNNNRGSKIRLKMMNLLKQQDADVLCLQEFYNSTDTTYYNNLNYMMKELGYPYYFYAGDNDGDQQWFGQAIFSKFPIVDSGAIRFPPPGMPESLIHADILFNNDTLRFYTTHLQSVQFKKQDYESIEKIKERDDSLIENSKNIFSKLRRGFIYRSKQAEIVKGTITNSPYPYVITGDFNDVPNSYTYFTISKNLQDAFLKKDFGVGRTYTRLSPTLRIDYILATKDFDVKQFNIVDRDYSDHYMLVADLQLSK